MCRMNVRHETRANISVLGLFQSTEMNSVRKADRSLIAHGGQIKNHLITSSLVFGEIATLSTGKPSASTNGRQQEIES